MLETIKRILEERISVADINPLFCPTCNMLRFSNDMGPVLQDNFSLTCKDCGASLCTVTDRPDRTFVLNESPVPE